MIIVKSIGLGLLSLIVGNLVALILSMIVSVAVEPITKKILSEPSLKKFRHIWSWAWVGVTVGMINSSLIFYFKMNGIILTLIFIIYLVFFMNHKNDFVFSEVCVSDVKQFMKLSRTTEAITFIAHMISLYGLRTIFMKWS